jgi:predicted NAD-dependent protein-ADP-ribosyltransferase YbiA (DUF1768 family)
LDDAKKGRTVQCIEIKQHILKSETPGIAKELGRKVKILTMRMVESLFEIVVERERE